MKNGEIKEYKNILKKKRPNKLNKRGKDKTKRKLANKPFNLKNEINRFVKNADNEKRQLIYNFLLTLK